MYYTSNGASRYARYGVAQSRNIAVSNSSNWFGQDLSSMGSWHNREISKDGSLGNGSPTRQCLGFFRSTATRSDVEVARRRHRCNMIIVARSALQIARSRRPRHSSSNHSNNGGELEIKPANFHLLGCHLVTLYGAEQRDKSLTGLLELMVMLRILIKLTQRSLC